MIAYNTHLITYIGPHFQLFSNISFTIRSCRHDRRDLRNSDDHQQDICARRERVRNREAVLASDVVRG